MDLKHYEQILSDLHPIGRYLFSPPSSSTTASTRAPLEPTHAPTASISGLSEYTLILERSPASRATDLTITVPS